MTADRAVTHYAYYAGVAILQIFDLSKFSDAHIQRRLNEAVINLENALGYLKVGGEL